MLWAAENEEYAISGCAECPREETLKQRERYFSNIKFSTIKEVLEQGKSTAFL